MAIAYIGSSGFIVAQNETSQNTITSATLPNTIQVGRLVVIAAAINNIATADGETSDITSITDTKENLWIKAGEFTNTVGGAAGDGATCAIWYSLITTELTTSDTITVNFSANTTAKVIFGRVFSLIAGNTVIATSLQTLANDNADAGSMTISGLNSLEYLFYRAIASETDVFTWTLTSGYNANAQGGQSGTGGSEKNHMSVNSEFRILTGTSSTSDPTMTDTTADRASLFIAFYELPLFKNRLNINQSVKRASFY